MLAEQQKSMEPWNLCCVGRWYRHHKGKTDQFRYLFLNKTIDDKRVIGVTLFKTLVTWVDATYTEI